MHLIGIHRIGAAAASAVILLALSFTPVKSEDILPDIPEPNPLRKSTPLVVVKPEKISEAVPVPQKKTNPENDLSAKNKKAAKATPGKLEQNEEKTESHSPTQMPPQMDKKSEEPDTKSAGPGPGKKVVLPNGTIATRPVVPPTHPKVPERQPEQKKAAKISPVISADVAATPPPGEKNNKGDFIEIVAPAATQGAVDDGSSASEITPKASVDGFSATDNTSANVSSENTSTATADAAALAMEPVEAEKTQASPVSANATKSIKTDKGPVSAKPQDGPVTETAADPSGSKADQTVRPDELVNSASQNSEVKPGGTAPPPKVEEPIDLPVPNPLRKANISPPGKDAGTTGADSPAQLESTGISPENSAGNVGEKELALTVLEALTPLLALQVTESDKENAVKAVRAIYKDDYKQSAILSRNIENPLVLKIVRWYHYRSEDTDLPPSKVEDFRLKNKSWPSQDLIRKRAEYRLFKNDVSSKEVLEFFKAAPPETPEGKGAYALALLDTGDRKRARDHASSAWREGNFEEETENDFIKRLGSLLTGEDHRHRMDHLFYVDRRSYVAAGLRAAKHLSGEEQQKADFRAAVIRRQNSKAKKLFSKLPKEAMDDPGVYLNRIQWLRRNNRDKEAWRLLRKLPFEPAQLFNLDEWWIERRVNCRRALNKGFSKIAYDIASNHGPISGQEYAEAEFLSGWIALRFLNDPEKAEKHLLAHRTSARYEKEMARADYWLGRSAAQAGKTAEAEGYFTSAARHNTTYYGQLASISVPSSHHRIAFPSISKPTDSDIKNIQSNDAVKAMVLAHKMDLEKLVPVFAGHLAYRFSKPGELVLLTELTRKLGQTGSSVRIAKIAVARDMPLQRYAYPIDVFPDYKKLNEPVDQAFIHALSRQESEFNPRARSRVGALGLMQIMPATAKKIARMHKVNHEPHRLSRDPSYNAMLGVAHLRDLLNDYGNSYILTMVAYNAGPGRVRQWIKKFGDPRSPEVDPIDWIEQVPFTETRKYIQKILASIQVFRARFDESNSSIKLAADLNRGRDVSAWTHTVASGGN